MKTPQDVPVLDNTYVFDGKIYGPGPNGLGVVHPPGTDPVELPDGFPMDKVLPSAGGSRSRPVQPSYDPPPSTDSTEDEDEGDDTDYSVMSFDDLRTLAEERGVMPAAGSGANGRVVKADLIEALSAKE